jgi:hypothetical protein
MILIWCHHKFGMNSIMVVIGINIVMNESFHFSLCLMAIGIDELSFYTSVKRHRSFIVTTKPLEIINIFLILLRFPFGIVYTIGRYG